MENFEKININDVFVIDVNITRSTLNEAIEFRKIVEEEINSGHTNLVIDLSKCVHIESTFFGAIIMAREMMNDIGDKLRVVKPVNPKDDIFMLTNTIGLFDLYKTREEAIKSFEEDIQPES